MVNVYHASRFRFIKKLAGVRRFASELSGVNGQMPSCCNSSYRPLTPVYYILNHSHSIVEGGFDEMS